MTPEEMERGMKVLQENATVQGVMMHRLENNLDRLENDLHRLEGVVSQLAAGMTAMHLAMTGLFERMDRFIRGLESGGYRNPQEGKA